MRITILHLLLATSITFAGSFNLVSPQISDPAELWQQVEVIRTDFGVPHIQAENFKSAGFALAWLQLEDHGPRTAMNILSASGRAASVLGYERIGSDLAMRRLREKVKHKYPTLSVDVLDVYEGFAAGINRFIKLHPNEFSPNMPTDFTGFDVASAELVQPNEGKIRRFIEAVSPRSNSTRPQSDDPDADDEGSHPDDGSNAWAFAPTRTKSGKSILMRNPHLQWSAGYYEAHLTVPGKIDFYGDFRIGGAFIVIGGFNKDLGFSTTNNQQDLDEFYALDADPKNVNHYLFDGKSVPLKRELLTAPFRNGESISTETREFWSTDLGPVVHRANGKIYIMKYAGDGEIRAGEQFLKMMRATSLKEWLDAMKMRARMTSNFTYADRAGNILYLWNAALPKLPHPPVNDLTAVPAKGIKDVWTEYVPFESLPQVLNPPGGYVHNENSSHHYTNIRTPVDTSNSYPNFEEPRLSLRSQLAIQFVNGDDKFSLEDIVELKHNYRALLADRVKSDLLTAVRKTSPTGDVANAVDLLEQWDNTTSPGSRGSVIFQEWWRHYSGIRDNERQPLPDGERYAAVWSKDEPFSTPRGLANWTRAVESFVWAVEEVKKRYGQIDVAWGDVHRVRRGNVDVPVGGCGNDLGCFRIMNYTRQSDGKFAATGGDCWVFAVEFGDVPRGYSILAYGQSNKPESPYYSDQAAMFARGEMKPIAFTRSDIQKRAKLKYRPGEKPVR
ncbi:penicillin acylase family protein [Leptolyngbya sp. 7M]|uniref:penicillin acylase family protein n=1 Tax=Leptolyngbya sp. 7M TaxID=2812896 RepID=UPI001B8BE04A|nr:penicillin acylase family protein [Leptolyngbya sp. 7M]QYO66133.1 penicillin acylase family protein [Leptolyngbya sp. 7M]